MSLAPSTRLGPYELRSLLGSGGMGEVYRARDARLGREVAIKVLPAEYSADPDRLRRFEQEARAAAALNHPNILAVFDVGTETDTPYVVSELLEGQTLRDALGAGRLPIRKALDYATQVAMGLAAAHEKGIIHRDIKPENVFVTADGRVKLLDFGLAKLREENVSATSATLAAGEGRSSTAGMVIGTVGYMSPEQVRAEPVDHRTDIFSFGATFYEMVSGSRAFKGTTAIETLHAILNQDPPELSIPDTVATPGLARVIHHCLEKDPSQRFQSARDLSFALGQLTVASTSGIVVSRAPASAGRRRLLAAAVAIVAVLALTGAAYLFIRGKTGGVETVASQPSFQQVTFRRGHICCPRFTPDGQTVLSNASWDGGPWGIVSTRLDTLASTTLGLDGARLLSISRSGELALLVKGDTLARVPLGQMGGIRELRQGVRDADWAPDGTLAAIRVEGRRNWLEYPLGQTIFEDGATMWTARVSPDGELVAIMQQRDKEWLTIVDRRGNVRSRSQRRPNVFQEGLAWTPDGREVWFSAAEVMFKSAIRAMTPDGRERLVHRSAGSIRIDDIAPDGRALVVHDLNHSDMRVVDTQTHAERNLAWSAVAFRPLDVSDDGRYLTFQAPDADGQFWAYIRQTDGSPAVQLGDGFPLAISPDSKWVLVSTPSTPGAPLRQLPVGAGEMRTFSRGRLENVGPPGNWTPDGQRIVFVGNEAGRPPRIFVQHVSGGDPAPVTPEGRVFPPIVSADSSAILGADVERRLVRYRLDGLAPPAALDGALPGDLPLAWSPDDTSVWVLVRETPAKIFRIDLRTGRRTLWYEVPLSDPASSAVDTLLVKMSADGSKFVYAYDKHLADLYVAHGLR